MPRRGANSLRWWGADGWTNKRCQPTHCEARVPTVSTMVGCQQQQQVSLQYERHRTVRRWRPATSSRTGDCGQLPGAILTSTGESQQTVSECCLVDCHGLQRLDCPLSATGLDCHQHVTPDSHSRLRAMDCHLRAAIDCHVLQPSWTVY
jgi:hypothetical protein